VKGLRIYQDNVDIFYNLQGLKEAELTKQEQRAINRFWQNTYIVRADGVVARRDGGDGGDGSVVVSIGEPIASAGGGVTGETTEKPRSRSWQRARRLWEKAVKKYSDVRARNYVDNVVGRENVQRDRWIESMGSVIAMGAGGSATEGEEGEERAKDHPTRPEAEDAGEELAALQRVIDVGVGGMSFANMQPRDLGTIDGELDGT